MAEFSLLWPDGRPTPTWYAAPDVIRDLELEAIVRAIATQGSYRDAVREGIFRLAQDPQTIRYRQIVLADLQARPELSSKLEELLPLLDELTQFTYRQIGRSNELHEVIARARELELLVETVGQFHDAFAAIAEPLRSTGLIALRDQVSTLMDDPQFQSMVHDLPALLEALRSHASITIGVNLDHRLQPEAAVLLSVNEKPFTDNSLLDRLLGKEAGEGKGIAPLHRPPAIGDIAGSSASGRPRRVDPLMVPLFKDLSKVLQKVSEPVARALDKYVQLNGRFLAELRPEIIFYTQVLNLIGKLQAAGMPMTYPQITPAEQRVCRVKEAYNLQLALQKLDAAGGQAGVQPVVANDITFDDDGRIAILTGPNRGGKTTYMQSIGLVQVLAQTGMPVPGVAAEISPVDAIYTHYPVEERLELGTGRFGDEAQRIRTIFEEVSPQSLVLLNESLSTTSMGEGVFLARDIIRALRQIGVRAVFTTHMHELASEARAINQETPGDSAVFSLVASRPAGDKPPADGYSYHIRPGPPLGRSYAEHIAAEYGISEEQLQTLIETRFSREE